MSARSGAGPDLVGRERELRALDEVVAAARGGHAQVVVLRGDPGMGKTALLHALEEASSGWTVLRAAGVETETELAYAGLHQLVAPLLGGIAGLPAPQAEALRAAFGLSDDRSPDPFLVGLAVLGLVTGSSTRQPLVCLVDDAHRLDRASGDILAFVGRRLASEAVVLAFASPPPVELDFLAAFGQIAVAGLADRDARTVLQTVVPGLRDERILRRVVAEAGGNPLALLEVSRGLTPRWPDAGLVTPGTRTLPSRAMSSYARRLASLPEATRRLLLVFAAEPVQEPLVIWAAASRLGLGPADALPAETEGLLDVGEARFSHPVVRSAVYQGAPADERRDAHRALADATCPELEPDLHAWHRAHATVGPDEGVALGLERSTGRALARGGLTAAAAFWELAAALTPEHGPRADRALRAAEHLFRAGAHERARQLLSIATVGDDDRRRAAEVSALHAQIAASLGDQDAESLLAAARRLEPWDRERAVETYRDAFDAALVRGRHAGRDGVEEVAQAARAALATASPAGSTTGSTTGLLEGLVRTVADGGSSGVPERRDSLAAFAAADLSTQAAVGWLPFAVRTARDVWDETTWDDLSTRAIAEARGSGRLPVLADVLSSRIALELFAGDLPAARALAHERDAVAAASDGPHRSGGDLAIAAWRGDERRLEELVAEHGVDATESADGRWSTEHPWTSAMLRNGRREYPEALAAADEGSADPGGLGVVTWSAVELVEAAAGAGSPERGREALQQITDVADACGTEWALGVAARSRALLSDGAAAEALYREAIDRLGRTRLRFVLARAHLVYGEWLRREERRTDAREQLRVAHDMLADMGADAFAARARHELAATGVTTRRRTVETLSGLTEQESQIAALAATGHTNPEIAALLFLSHRTVEWHLRKVYSKLGISSRKEVRHALGPRVGERVAS